MCSGFASGLGAEGMMPLRSAVKLGLFDARLSAASWASGPTACVQLPPWSDHSMK